MKGFQRLIPMMRYLPEADLRIAGTGPYEAELRADGRRPAERPLRGPAWRRRAGAAVPGCPRRWSCPSLFPETFGYVVLEAFAVRTPVIVHEGGGAIDETGVQSGGGLGYRTDIELLTAMRRIIHEPDLRDALAARGYARRIGEWSEERHLERYLDLIERAALGASGPFALSARPGPHGPAGRGRPPLETSPDGSTSPR